MKKLLLFLIVMALGISAHAQNPGNLDLSFDPGTGADSDVRTITLQPDGKIIIGGGFASYNGTAMNRITRLNADGTIDASFTVGTGANNRVRSIALQSDGKIIIGGDFSSYNGIAMNCVARLNSDGTLDESFTVGTGATGANSGVYTIAVQTDGKIIIGGAFTMYNGTATSSVARLNIDGTRDVSFNVGSEVNGGVRTTSIQPDGKILIGGDFTSLVARLNADGTLDASFDLETGQNSAVHAVALQLDGKIVIVGEFTSYDGTPMNRVARLNADGTLDGSFVLGTGAGGSVWTTAIEVDGSIIIGGLFTSYDGTPMNRIARLNADGTLDVSFDAGTAANSDVYSTAIQSDGKIIVGGLFTFYDGTVRNYIARLHGACVPPTADVGSAVPPICQGATSAALDGSFDGGATAAIWSDGGADGTFENNTGSTPATATYTAASNASTPITLTLTTSGGSCGTATATKQIVVNPTPTVSANETATSVCSGSPVTLSGGGANTYAWTDGVTDAVPFTPDATITYAVTGTDVNGCQGTANTTITVNPLPTVSADATATSVCSGTSVTLTGGGASTYTWTGGVTDGIAFTPDATATYIVTGTDVNECQSIALVEVTVNPIPTINFTGIPTFFTVNDPPVLLEATPGGGTFSGVSVIGTMFYPAAAGTGEHCILYAYTEPLTLCSATSTQCVTVDLGVGVEHLSVEYYTVFPNPTSDHFDILVPNLQGQLRYDVFSPMGQVIRSGTITSEHTAMDIQGTAAGIYSLRVSDTSGQSIGTRRVVVQ